LMIKKCRNRVFRVDRYKKIKIITYMSLFISNENQNLLFEMIHKTPEIQKAFSTVDEKNTWFREVIEHFFNKLPPSITREVLKQVNRDALGYMVNTLKTICLNKEQIQIQKPLQMQSLEQPMLSLEQQPQTQYKPTKREQTLEPKEYTTFFDLPKPKIIDFSEKLDDDVITNMDELIEEQKRMRERELQEYTVLNPPPSNNIDILQPQQQQQQQNIKIQIPQTQLQSQSIKISILEDLPKAIHENLPKTIHENLPNAIHENLPKTIHNKRVQFADTPSMEEKINTIEKKLDILMDMFQKMQPLEIKPTNQDTKNPDVNIIKNLLTITE